MSLVWWPFFQEVSIEEVKAEIHDASQVSLTLADDLLVSQQPAQLQQPVQPQQHQERLPPDPSRGFRGAPHWTTRTNSDCDEDSSDINTSAESSWGTDTPVTDHGEAATRLYNILSAGFMWMWKMCQGWCSCCSVAAYQFNAILICYWFQTWLTITSYDKYLDWYFHGW